MSRCRIQGLRAPEQPGGEEEGNSRGKGLVHGGPGSDREGQLSPEYPQACGEGSWGAGPPAGSLGEGLGEAEFEEKETML